MKLHRLLLVGTSMLVLAACSDDSAEVNQETANDGIEQVEKAEAGQTEVETSPGEGLTLDSFGKALDDAGMGYEVVEKEPAFIRATAGRGYRINGDVVELYKYVEGSEIFEEIKEKEFIEIEDLIAFEVEINGQFALALNEHPDAAEILEVYNSLDGSK